MPIAAKMGKRVIILGNDLTGSDQRHVQRHSGSIHRGLGHRNHRDGSLGRDHRHSLRQHTYRNAEQQSGFSGAEVNCLITGEIRP